MSPDQLQSLGTSKLRRLMTDWADKPDWIKLIRNELARRGDASVGGDPKASYKEQGIGLPATQPSPTGVGDINQFYPQDAKRGAQSNTTPRPAIQTQPVPRAPGTTPGIGAVGPIQSSQLPQVNHGREAFTPGEALNMQIDWENQLRADDAARTQQGLSALYNAQGVADRYSKDTYGLLGRADQFLQQNQGIAAKQFGDESKFIKSLGANQYQRVRDSLGNNVGSALSEMAGRGMLNSSTRFNTVRGYQSDAERQTQDVDASQARNWIDYYNRRGGTMMGINNQRADLQGRVADFNNQNADRGLRYGAQVADYMRGNRPGQVPGIPSIAGKDAQHGPSIGSAVLGAVAGPILGSVTGGIGAGFGNLISGAMFGRGGGYNGGYTGGYGINPGTGMPYPYTGR